MATSESGSFDEAQCTTEEISDPFENKIIKEYISHFVEEKKNLQNERDELQHQVIKLQESCKSMEENMEYIEKELKRKNKLIKLLENEVAALNANKEAQDNTILEYKNQNDILSQHLKNINFQKHENDINDINENSIHSMKPNTLSINDEINRLTQENTHLNHELDKYKAEQQSLLSNNEALKNLIETHQNQLKNTQKQNEDLNNALNHTKHMNEQLHIEINAKNDLIDRLNQHNDKLHSSNSELLQINLSQHNHSTDDHSKILQHHHDTTTQSQTSPQSLPVLAAMRTIPSMPSVHPVSVIPSTSVYEANLDIILKSVNGDEYKFMEDLNEEKKSPAARSIRSDIIKQCHSDAEKEFFFMLVLSIKLEISISCGFTNCSVSDIDAQTLWIKAQEQSIALHEFHGFIRNELVQIATQNKRKNEAIQHHWSSNMVDVHHLRQKQTKHVQQNGIKTKNKIKTIRVPKRPYSEQQTLIDEQEEHRRDAQKIKKTIIQSFNDRE